MSSDSDDEYSYTNSASVLKALKEKISIKSDLETSKNEVNFFDTSETELPTKNTRSKVKAADKANDTNNTSPKKKETNSCIILSDDENDADVAPINIISTIDKALHNNRGRRKRGARGRRNNQRQTRQSKKIKETHSPTISLLDTSATSTEISPDVDEINYELTVKILWKSQHLEKFTLRRFEKFTNIFEYFAKKENVPESRLLFTIKDSVVSKNDTPNTLNITAATIIDGGILSAKTNIVNNKNHDEDLIQLKVQMKDRKHPLLISLRSDDKMEILMCQCSEELDVPLNKLKFYFDGDLIKANHTPTELDFEGGEVIDCMKK